MTRMPQIDANQLIKFLRNVPLQGRGYIKNKP